jgi:hypothetical protein
LITLVVISSPRLDPFQNVLLKISFRDLINDSSSLPFRQWCPCVRCWKYSLVCALLKQGDDGVFIRCARQIRVFGGSCLPPWRYCTFPPSTDLSSCTQLSMQEDTLSDLAKKTGGFALGALIGKGGSKFGGLDIKRVYFGSA